MASIASLNAHIVDPAVLVLIIQCEQLSVVHITLRAPLMVIRGTAFRDLIQRNGVGGIGEIHFVLLGSLRANAKLR